MNSSVKGAVLPKTRQNEMARYSAETRHLFLHGLTLSILCAVSYWLATHMGRSARRHVGRGRYDICVSLQL